MEAPWHTNQSRYVVGIDLGTTNCSLAYVDTGAGDDAPRPTDLLIPQVVQPGVVEERPLLPSFLYLPGANELPAGSLKLPWDANRDYAVGEFARNRAARCRRAWSRRPSRGCATPASIAGRPVLPWKAPDECRKVSPLEAAHAYLKHLAEAWNATHRQGRARRIGWNSRTSC